MSQTVPKVLTNPGNGSMYFIDPATMTARKSLRMGEDGTSFETVDLQESFYNVRWFGAAVGGATDDTDAVNATIAAAEAAGGGTVYIPAGTCRCDGQIVRTTTKTIRLIGAGGGSVGGSQLDLRYASAPKIQSTTVGTFIIEGLTLRDTTDGTQPFIYTTNPVVHIHNVHFYGKTNATKNNGTPGGVLPVQDAIILGSATNDSLNGFQGYTSTIDRCSFNGIRRCVYARKYANGLVVNNSMVWNTCGADTDAAAFEFDGIVGVLFGLTAIGNIVEMFRYAYGFKLTRQQTALLLNHFYDPENGGVSQSYYHAPSATESIDNTIIAGEGDPNTALISGLGATKNRIVAARAGVIEQFAYAFSALQGMTVPAGQLITLGGVKVFGDAGGNFWTQINGVNNVAFDSDGYLPNDRVQRSPAFVGTSSSTLGFSTPEGHLFDCGGSSGIYSVSNRLILRGNGHDNTFVESDGSLVAGKGIIFPSADPHIAGAWWDNTGVLTKSSG